MKMEYLRISTAGSMDLSAIEQFFNTYAHPNVDVRCTQALIGALANGDVLKLETHVAQLVGATACYHLGGRQWEIGSTRIVYGGEFRLLEVLNSFQVILHFHKHRTETQLIINVRYANVDVIQRLKKLGWLEIQPDDKLLALHAATIHSGQSEDCWWAEFPPTRIEICANVLDQNRRAGLISRGGTRHLVVQHELIDMGAMNDLE